MVFRDITPLLGDAAGFARAVDELVDLFADGDVSRVIGIESRGFILAAPVAYRLGAGFVPARKAGKLPWAVVRESYESEYGAEKLELHRDAIHPGERVLVIDDVLATGGTAAPQPTSSKRSAASSSASASSSSCRRSQAASGWGTAVSNVSRSTRAGAG
ncbi:MAG: adenine phosphoribosyltransferase [Ilumatobacteraceae bacterium]